MALPPRVIIPHRKNRFYEIEFRIRLVKCHINSFRVRVHSPMKAIIQNRELSTKRAQIRRYFVRRKFYRTVEIVFTRIMRIKLRHEDYGFDGMLRFENSSNLLNVLLRVRYDARAVDNEQRSAIN